MAQAPTSFTKWLKHAAPLQILALVLAGPAITALIVFIIMLATFSGWHTSQQGLQLEILREGLAYSFIILLIITGALTAGLVRGFKVGVGKVSAELDLSDEDDDVEVKAKAAEAELAKERYNQVDNRTPSKGMKIPTDVDSSEFVAPDPNEEVIT